MFEEGRGASRESHTQWEEWTNQGGVIWCHVFSAHVPHPPRIEPSAIGRKGQQQGNNKGTTPCMYQYLCIPVLNPRCSIYLRAPKRLRHIIEWYEMYRLTILGNLTSHPPDSTRPISYYILRRTEVPSHNTVVVLVVRSAREYKPLFFKGPFSRGDSSHVACRVRVERPSRDHGRGRDRDQSFVIDSIVVVIS